MKQTTVDKGEEKVTKFLFTTTEPCLENEEDYNPCANCNGVTEKDLEILSKIEVAAHKAQSESKANQERNKKSGEKNWDKEKNGRDLKQDGGEKKVRQNDGRRWSKEKGEGSSKQEGDEKRIQKDDDKRWSKERTERSSKAEGSEKRLQKDDGRKWSKERGEDSLKQEGGKRGVQKDDGKRWSKEKAKGGWKQEGSEKKGQKVNRRNSKSSRKLTNETTAKGGASFDSGKETVGDVDAFADGSKRKTCQKKVKKNPFYRDRLALPSCISPPPRFPPPQLHPPADEFEEVECPKSRKTKPCRKKTVIRKIKTKSIEKSKSEIKEKSEQEVIETQYNKETEEESKQSTQIEEEIKDEKKDSIAVEEETEDETKGITDEEEKESKKDAERSVEEIKSETETRVETSEKRIAVVERRMSKAKAMKRSAQEEDTKKLGDFVSRNRKHNTKLVQRPCKKKVSEISISLLPPLIPPLQRNLPAISPKNIPEMQRQALMAEETKRALKRERCKGRLTNRAKNK